MAGSAMNIFGWEFDFLLKLLEQCIKKKDTFWRLAVPAKQRLILTIRRCVHLFFSSIFLLCNRLPLCSEFVKYECKLGWKWNCMLMHNMDDNHYISCCFFTNFWQLGHLKSTFHSCSDMGIPLWENSFVKHCPCCGNISYILLYLLRALKCGKKYPLIFLVFDNCSIALVHLMVNMWKLGDRQIVIASSTTIKDIFLLSF